ncbi:MAG TPA: hypothetical protein VGK49_04605 [Ilumatobacteraceae bacterium]
MQWVGLSDPGVDDPTVWEALTRLGMIDLDHGDDDGTHLYPTEQIEAWRSALA